MTGKRGELAHPVEHGNARSGEHLVTAGAARPARDGTFHAEDVERQASLDDVAEQ